MEKAIELLAVIGVLASLITPLTLVVGIINAIKKPKEEAKLYTFMAIISAYLIIVPLMYTVLKT